MPKKPKRIPEAHKWELAKGRKTFTVTYFPPLKPILLRIEEDKEYQLGAAPLIETKRYKAGMILRNHTYLKVYKCWRILPILKTPTIKCLAIFFKKYFNFQGFYIVYIIIWQFLG